MSAATFSVRPSLRIRINVNEYGEPIASVSSEVFTEDYLRSLMVGDWPSWLEYCDRIYVKHPTAGMDFYLVGAEPGMICFSWTPETPSIPDFDEDVQITSGENLAMIGSIVRYLFGHKDRQAFFGNERGVRLEK